MPPFVVPDMPPVQQHCPDRWTPKLPSAVSFCTRLFTLLLYYKINPPPPISLRYVSEGKTDQGTTQGNNMNTEGNGGTRAGFNFLLAALCHTNEILQTWLCPKWSHACNADTPTRLCERALLPFCHAVVSFPPVGPQHVTATQCPCRRLSSNSAAQERDGITAILCNVTPFTVW
jgi:hypothetical protein